MTENDIERRLLEIFGERPKGPPLNTKDVITDENVKMYRFNQVNKPGAVVDSADIYESEFGQRSKKVDK